MSQLVGRGRITVQAMPSTATPSLYFVSVCAWASTCYEQNKILTDIYVFAYLWDGIDTLNKKGEIRPFKNLNFGREDVIYYVR